MKKSPENSPEFPLPPPANLSKKKTRDLPNLSDCHCCKRRFNITNPKNRLRILTSEWRIVLLCKSCYCLVESKQTCSYCLSSVSCSSSIDNDNDDDDDDECFECKRCHRRIHRNCVSKFSFCNDVSVCFDCFVPKLVEDGYGRVCGVRTRKRAKVCEGLASLENVRVCDDDDDVGDKARALEEMVKEANVVAKKKIVVAVEAKEKALAKAAVARRAMERASDALGCVAVEKCGGDKDGLVVEDDAQLAIQLHRAMNSSPRISRSSCLLNTNCVNVTTVSKLNNAEGEANGVDTDCLLRREHTGVRLDENRQDCGPDSLSRKELSGFSLGGTRQNSGQKSGGTQYEKCNRDTNGCLITYIRKGRASRDGRCKEEPKDSVLRTYSRRLQHVERRVTKHERCLKTYSRRPSMLSCYKNKLLYGVEHGVLPATALDGCKESRPFASAS